MRLTGHRRGNPAVRFMIDQTARRRMYSALSPERQGCEIAPDIDDRKASVLKAFQKPYQNGLVRSFGEKGRSENENGAW